MEPGSMNVENKHVPQQTNSADRRVVVGRVPPVGENQRQTNEGFVRFVAGMIQRAAARIMTVMQRVFNKLFGWVSVLKPAVPKSNPVEQTGQPSIPQDVNFEPKSRCAVNTNQQAESSTNVHEFIKKFESLKERYSTHPKPERNASEQVDEKTPPEASLLKKPVLGRTNSIHCAEPMPEKPVLGRTNSIHCAKPLNLGEEEASQEKQIVSRCLNFLRQKEALTTKGIFRIPGREDRSAELKTGLLKGEMIPKGEDVHDVASAFKKFIMEKFQILPEASLVDIEGSDDKTKAWKNLVNDLDQDTKAAFQQIIRFLAEIAANSKTNNMRAENLAMTPGYAFVNAGEVVDLIKMQASKKAIKFLIENHQEIFSA